MKILIDADGCPVVDIAVELAKKYDTECIILCDTSHEFYREGVSTITVSKGADSVDFALVNLLQKGDVAITQDYGLAAMCLAKAAIPLHQDGMVYTDDNIVGLLTQRHTASKLRNSAKRRFHAQQKRKPEQDEGFRLALENILKAKGI